MKKIKIDEIGYDPNYYPRVTGKEDWLTVHKYTDALLADCKYEFPCIVVVKVTGKPYRYLIIDGLHRIRAYYKAGREEIPAIIEHLPQSKWLASSVELNATHGRQFDAGDKAFIATKLEHEGYSIEEIAKLLRCRVESIEKIKTERTCKITAKASKILPEGRSNRSVNGDHYGFLKAPFIEGANTPQAAEQALMVQGPVSSIDVGHILDSTIAVLECGVDMTDEEIETKVQRLSELTREILR